MTGRAERKPLAPGERVRVYSDAGMFTGKIESIGSTFVYVIGPGMKEGEGQNGFYPEQLRRLRPKKPKPVGAERKRIWVKGEELDTLFSPGFAYYLNGVTLFRDARKEYKEFVELKHGECVVSRDSFIEAWPWSEDDSTYKGALQMALRNLGLEGK